MGAPSRRRTTSPSPDQTRGPPPPPHPPPPRRTRFESILEFLLAGLRLHRCRQPGGRSPARAPAARMSSAPCWPFAKLCPPTCRSSGGSLLVACQALFRHVQMLCGLLAGRVPTFVPQFADALISECWWMAGDRPLTSSAPAGALGQPVAQQRRLPPRIGARGLACCSTRRRTLATRRPHTACCRSVCYIRCVCEGWKPAIAMQAALPSGCLSFSVLL